MRFSTELAALVLAASYCSAAVAAPHPWSSLSTDQQKALSPLSHNWDHLPEQEQQRLLDRLKAWNSLTPEQREKARKRFRAFSKVPADKQQQVREMVHRQEAEKQHAGKSAE